MPESAAAITHHGVGDVLMYMVSRAADSVALGCVTLAPRFNFSTLRYSEEIFVQLVVNPTLLSLH